MNVVFFSFRSRKDEVPDDVLEVLGSIGNFLAFKEQMLAYKAVCREMKQA